jgi:hypothetical protein
VAKKTKQQQVKAAISSGNKLTQSEVRNLQNAGISMNQILTVAAKNNATIGQNAQQVYNIDQNKKGVISYTPPAYAEPPKPGSGWAITGSQAVQSRSHNGGVSTGHTPTYTYMAPTTVKVTQSGPYDGMMDGATSQGGPVAPATNATQNWSDSIDAGTQAMIDALNQSILDNQANQQLYMGMMSDMMSQMAAVQQPQQVATPYAVTTSTNAPAQGAQMTQAIAPRKKNLNTSLAITPLETATAGTGLNIPV